LLARGEDAFKLFQKDSGAFQMYHTGYQEQMSHWPQQPVQVIVDWLKAHSPKLVVADFGCGTLSLSKSLLAPSKLFAGSVVTSLLKECSSSYCFYLQARHK
jgi:ribosomal RNA-processing protein 8